MADANISLAVVGIALTLFLYGIDKMFDLIQNMNRSEPLSTIIYFKALLGFTALGTGAWMFLLLGVISSVHFWITLFALAIIIIVLPLGFEINRIKKLRNKPI